MQRKGKQTEIETNAKTKEENQVNKQKKELIKTSSLHVARW